MGALATIATVAATAVDLIGRQQQARAAELEADQRRETAETRLATLNRQAEDAAGDRREALRRSLAALNADAAARGVTGSRTLGRLLAAETDAAGEADRRAERDLAAQEETVTAGLDLSRRRNLLERAARQRQARLDNWTRALKAGRRLF